MATGNYKQPKKLMAPKSTVKPRNRQDSRTMNPIMHAKVSPKGKKTYMASSDGVCKA